MSVVRLPENTFKHVYLSDKWADRNQILSEVSLGCGKCCIRFWARSDWTLVSTTTDSSHRVIMVGVGVGWGGGGGGGG